MEALNIISDSLETFWAELGVLVPRLAVAFVLLVAGWGAAKLLRRATIRLLRSVRLDEFAEKAGFEDFLLQGGVRYTTVTIIAQILYWLVIFTVILGALNVLRIQATADLFNRLVLYIPNVIVAVIALLLGSLFGRLVRGAAFTYLNNIGIEGAVFISHVAQWAIIIFFTSIALEQLSIGGQILISAFQIAFGAFCLALALAFGLGGRRWAEHILGRLWKE